MSFDCGRIANWFSALFGSMCVYMSYYIKKANYIKWMEKAYMHSALSPSQFEFCLRCELQRVYRCCYNQITLYIFSMFYKRLDDENKRNFFSSHEPECIAKPLPNCGCIATPITTTHPPALDRDPIKLQTNERMSKCQASKKSGDVCKMQESTYQVPSHIPS